MFPSLKLLITFQIEGYLTKCLIAIWNIRYNSIHCAANILAGLVSYHVCTVNPEPGYLTVHDYSESHAQ